MATSTLPKLPAPLGELISHIDNSPQQQPLTELFQPYRDYEAEVRRLYAQEPTHPVLKDHHINVLPLFTADTSKTKIRARNLGAESDEEKSRYIMSLPDEIRRSNGSPATVQSLTEFKRNFNIFSESSLVEMNWSNVVAAGSSVVNCLLPVPEEYNVSKRTLREFFHEKFAPASDVDLFLYGLTEEEAIEKIKDIEARVRDALLTETTTVRTKNAVTICSQYPVRHVQIVLRIYNSVSEILTGFDIDSSGAAFDGKQVYCTPRALQSYISQINHVDLTRRSPSYENRLSKYSHRGFEVYWKDLDRPRIDPTIFERSFNRLLGLARLLVLERLPKQSDRDSYLDKRRVERGRPRANRYKRRQHTLFGNIKEEHEDEVAEWVQEEEESSYNTFTVPYGPKFHAKRIEKLCYTRDLLLNAEWNQDEKREVYLHRHPAFFGRFEDVMNDCCGYCPKPVTDEEKEVAEKESKIYVSGKISFMKDDPGRQEIGSFNPVTDEDWTEMAYVGNTARLCQAIVDCDAEHVEDWLAQEDANPNVRDYTGRTPLQLAVMSSTPEIVRLLVNAGARLVARIADGRTALHLATERGDVEIVKILLDKSEANEAEEEEKQEQKRKAKAAAGNDEDSAPAEVTEDKDSTDDESEGEWVEDEDLGSEGRSMATGSFVKVGKVDTPVDSDEVVPDDDEEEPDFYDINVIAWDNSASALHLAIISGHEEVVKVLCQEYGADVLLPVKLMGYNNEVSGALLTLVLALCLPVEKAKSMATTLLGLGATCAQADMYGITAFHSYVKAKAEELVEVLWESDAAGCKTALNHIAFTSATTAETPLQAAARNGDLNLVLKLLDKGALAEIDFETWLKSAKQQIENQLKTFEENKLHFESVTEQPLIQALKSPTPAVVLDLMKRGVDPNTLTTHAYQNLDRLRNNGYAYGACESALDLVRTKLKKLRDYKPQAALGYAKLPLRMDEHLATYKEGTYQHWTVSRDIDRRRQQFAKVQESKEQEKIKYAAAPGIKEKQQAVQKAIKSLEEVERVLVEKGAKTFEELHPEETKKLNQTNRGRSSPSSGLPVSTYYSYTFSLQKVVDVTEVRKAAYLDLLEAAWQGDLGTIKKLTLTSWDALGQEPPLKMAFHDNANNNPFSLAFYRGHYDVAAAILEIVHLQYSPEEKPKTRYRMKHSDEEEEYDSDYDSEAEEDDDDSEPAITAELVDQRVTFENVGQVSMKVKSKTKPLEVLRWACQNYAEVNQIPRQPQNVLMSVIRNNDCKGLKFLLDLGAQYCAKKQESQEEDESSRLFSLSSQEFVYALQHGSIELLTEIIRRTGAGMPLDHLVESSGVELVEKPRYYQGLTVYGKKRQDWADAQRGVHTKQSGGTTTSPLLTVALAGRIDCVEWFLSDTPLRLYLEFGKSKAAVKDKRLQHLSQAPGGFEGAVSTWLDNQRDRIIHAAVLARPCERNNALAAYLIKTCPDMINAKSEEDVTPLMVAAKLGRIEIARMLITAGADPTMRNSRRENLLHLALRHGPTPEKIDDFLAIFPHAVVQRLAHERDSHHDGGKTPLHRWLAEHTTDQALAVLAVLLKRTGGAELDYLDGAGDTILHTLVLRSDYNLDVVRAVIDARPSLLHRENAVGRTPVEVARDSLVASKLRNTEVSTYYGRKGYHYANRYWAYDNEADTSIASIVDREPKTFVTDPADEAITSQPRTTTEKMWDLIRESAAAHPGKRRLASLLEANDVARRLGEPYVTHQGRYRFRVKQPELSAKEKERQTKRGGGEDIVTSRWNESKTAWKDFGKEEESNIDLEIEDALGAFQHLNLYGRYPGQYGFGGAHGGVYDYAL